MPEYEFHPAAAIFDLIEGEDFDRLVEGIKAVGLEQDIMLYEGKIIDGRNRYRACKKLGIAPRYRDADVGESAADYVASVNIARQMTKLQRIASAARWTREKKAEGEARGGRNGVASPDGLATGRSAEIAEKKFGVSKTTIKRALSAMDGGLWEQVESGEMTLTAASEASIVARGVQRSTTTPPNPSPTAISPPPQPSTDIEPSPQQYRDGYANRADLAVSFAYWPDRAPKPDQDSLDWAKRVIEKWTEFLATLQEKMR